MRIDSHQHFWSYSEAEYPWMKPEWPIRRDFLPPDLEPHLKEAGLHGSIAVQARQSMEESRWLLSLAERYESVLGVVGWVDLRSPEVEAQLAELAPHPKFVGVRHVVQDEPDDNFLLQPDFLRGIKLLKQFNLAYDILIFPKQLPAAVKFVKRFPDQPFVLDHIAKPSIKDGTLEPWAEHIRELAKHPNVMCKISGMVTEAKWNAWTSGDFRPYLDIVIEAFGEDRLMYGSDWPVCLLSGSYAETYQLAMDYLGELAPLAQRKVWGGNAAHFYGIDG
ncbi:MAG TPA: amidohydrolase family protein [Roseimicrobium sp.]|nr:amidohydrolase family protein [Roseimicrobium sp.]